MKKTPWAKGASSLPSDRVPPRRPNSKQPNTGMSKSKGKETGPPEPPKSAAVRKLETEISNLRQASLVDPDPKGGCFCQARTHELSELTPICRSCGLVLCALNLPQYCCPSCFNPLLTPTTVEPIINQLDEQLAATIMKETEERERALEEAKRAAGAFPSLSGSNAPSPSPSPLPSMSTSLPSSHKVISLTGKKNKVIVSSYTTKSTKPAVPTAPLPTVVRTEEEPLRIPPPPPEVPHSAQKPTPSRPFQNLIDGAGQYLPPPPPPVDEASEPRATRRRRKNKGKEKETDKENIEEKLDSSNS